MDSCPKELEPYDKAHEKMVEEQDHLQYLWWGNYGISAFIVAIDQCFSKNSQAKYLDEPILSGKRTSSDMSEEEKQREVDRFFATERARRVNWRRSHKEKQVE